MPLRRFASILSDLLNAARELPPWLVPELARVYSRALGAESATVYLQDYDQLILVPLTAEATPGPPPSAIPIDGTPAGRAYMTGAAVSSLESERRRLYLPLLGGTERVGLLELCVPEAGSDGTNGVEGGGAHDAVEPQWTAFAAVIAELIASKGRQTDVYFQARRRRPMGLAAEMQWHLLPPLTISDPRVVIAGCLEPAYEVGGDGFDYAINRGTAHFAIFDAMGHGVGASVMAAVAMGAYRHARRAGVPVEEMYPAVGEAFATQFGEECFVTAQMAALDLALGRLVLVNAGHPAPLLIRGQRVIQRIDGRPALPLGLGLVDTPPVVTVADLEPGDALLLYSDGVLDAEREGQQYNESMFADDVECVIADPAPLAETVRRLNRRLLDWRGGTSRDDSTLLMIEWRTGEFPQLHAPSGTAEKDRASSHISNHI